MSCYNTLKQNGLKITPQRKLIMDFIHDSSAHLSAEGIVYEVQNRMPEVNKSTIYRTLELLERLGCVFKSESGNGHIYHHAEQGHHHHLVCSKCGITIDCEEDIFAPVERLLQENHGFQIDFRHLVMSGLCKECKNKRN